MRISNVSIESLIKPRRMIYVGTNKVFGSDNVIDVECSLVITPKLVVLAKDSLSKDVTGKPPNQTRKKAPHPLGGQASSVLGFFVDN